MSNMDPTKNTTQKTKKMSNMDPTKNQGWIQELRTYRHIIGRNEQHVLQYLKPWANSRDRDNIEHMTQNKYKQNKDTARNLKMMSNTNPTKKKGMKSGALNCPFTYLRISLLLNILIDFLIL
jgi:hypothetical protein